MRRARLSVLVAVVAGALALGAPPARAQTGEAPPDARSTEVLRYDCTSELGRRDVTLFANGTVRVRQGLWEDRRLHLHELDPEEMVAVLARLREIADDDAFGQTPIFPLAGLWVDRCWLALALPGEPAERHELSGSDALGGRLGRLVQAAEDLASWSDAEEERGPGLPSSYRPEPGDVLVGPQGDRFRVLRYTVDGLAVELQGISQPLTIYVALADLAEAFAAVEPAEPPP